MTLSHFRSFLPREVTPMQSLLVRLSFGSSLALIGVGSFTGCSSKTGPDLVTETGNPPFVDDQRIQLVVGGAGGRAIGAPGAVPAGAEVELENQSTGNAGTTTAEDDGSFEVAVAGDADDAYALTVTSNGRSANVTLAPAACPTFSAGVVEPTRVNTRVQRFEGVESLNQLVVGDEEPLQYRIYWKDEAGRVQAQIQHTDGSPSLESPRELRQAPTEPFTSIGNLLANETTLFWAEGDAYEKGVILEPGPPPPPGRLFAANKDGSGSELLYEDPAQLLHLRAVHGEDLILTFGFEQLELFAFSLTDRELRPIAPQIPGGNARVLGDEIYWTVATEGSSDVTGYFQDLFRADLNGDGTKFVAKIQGWSSYTVTPNTLLWLEERTHFNPLVLDENFVYLNRRTGCQQPLPHRGESVSMSYRVDETHVYWHSFNALGVVSSPSDGPAPPLDVMPLIRVDLSTGALEELVAPGFESRLGDHPVAQTVDKLFIGSAQGLVALDKPGKNDPPPDACVWGLDNLLAEVGVSVSARKNCGTFSASSGDVPQALECVESAPADPGAQLTLNYCVDCSIPSVYVKTPAGQLFHVRMEADVFGDELREASVERCAGLEREDFQVECLEPELLYSCTDTLLRPAAQQ